MPFVEVIKKIIDGLEMAVLSIREQKTEKELEDERVTFRLFFQKDVMEEENGSEGEGEIAYCY